MKYKIILIISIFCILGALSGCGVKTVEESKFRSDLYAGKICMVHIEKDTAGILKWGSTIKPATFPKQVDYKVNISNRTEFVIILERFNLGLDAAGNPSNSSIYERWAADDESVLNGDREVGTIKLDENGFAKFKYGYGKVKYSVGEVL